MLKNVKSIMIVVTVTILLGSVIVITQNAEAASYRNIVNVKFYGKADCIAQKTDEVYFRISSNVKNPDNADNHDQLIAKGEIENLGNYLKNLEAQGKPLVVTFVSTFDLQKFESKYHTVLKVLREYIELYQHEKEIFDEYKYQTFSKTRTQYTWNHGVDLGC